MSRSWRKPAVWIPQTLTLHNFLGIFGMLDTQQGLPVAQYFINSLVISVTSTVVAIAIGMMGGYAFARYRFRGKAALFLGFMLTPHGAGHRAVPAAVHPLGRIGLIDTHFG